MGSNVRCARVQLAIVGVAAAATPRPYIDQWGNEHARNDRGQFAPRDAPVGLVDKVIAGAQNILKSGLGLMLGDTDVARKKVDAGEKSEDDKKVLRSLVDGLESLASKISKGIDAVVSANPTMEALVKDQIPALFQAVTEELKNPVWIVLTGVLIGGAVVQGGIIVPAILQMSLPAVIRATIASWVVGSFWEWTGAAIVSTLLLSLKVAWRAKWIENKRRQKRERKKAVDGIRNFLTKLGGDTKI